MRTITLILTLALVACGNDPTAPPVTIDWDASFVRPTYIDPTPQSIGGFTDSLKIGGTIWGASGEASLFFDVQGDAVPWTMHVMSGPAEVRGGWFVPTELAGWGDVMIGAEGWGDVRAFTYIYCTDPQNGRRGITFSTDGRDLWGCL